MEIYFSPECFKQDGQILNVVDERNNPIGYFSFIIDEKKMYVYGHLENEGVSEMYKDMVKAYIQGLAKAKEGIELYTYIAVGGKKIEMKKDEE